MSTETRVKIFRVTGTYHLKHKKYLFRKECRALNKEDALEKAYCEVSSIGLSRRQIHIKDIKEIKPEEVENLLIRELSQL
ncbi:MAG: 50S ribosomal protein L18Ae [Promethearchaeia archaeon]